MAGETRNSWINSITAVSTTVAATLLLGFITTVKDIAARGPLIESHMQSTSAELVSIKEKQAEHSIFLAALAKDYTSRDSLKVEIEKLDAKIRELQVQQAVLGRAHDTRRR